MTMHHHSPDRRRRADGQVMLLTAILLLAGSMLIVGAITALVQSQVRVMTELSFSKSSYALAEGALEEVVYRYLNGMNVGASETLTEGTVSVVTSTTNIPGGKEVIAAGDANDRIRKIRAELIEGDGVAFSFGVQTHNGGLILENSSSVDGNVYSNGPIEGHNLNLITGTVISAGPSGRITEVHATGSAYAHAIDNSYIEEDAHYQTIDLGTTVDGTKYPGSPDLATSTLPIDDALLDAWEAYAASSTVLTAECAAAGGTIVYDADVTLGPARIPCNVKFEKFPTVTISGVLWIEGNLEFTQGPEFEIDPALGNKSVPIVVDNQSDRLTSSRVRMRNSGSWSGNGNRSYVLIVSRNESAETGGSEAAITIEQSTGGALLVYAGHGEIVLQNNTDLTMITAWRVRLQNLTEVHYDRGIAASVFTVGPGGGYTIDSWEEVE